VQFRVLALALGVFAVQLASFGLAAAQADDGTPEDSPALAAAEVSLACQHTALPAYFGLGPQWDQMVNLGRESDIAIVNLADGPGPKPREDYRAGIQRARQSGAKVVGYVYTLFGARDIQQVKTDVDNFKSWFGVDGIFIDNMSAEAAMLPYYRELHDYIKSSPGGFIVGNPGLVPDRGYMDTSDVLVVFEGTYDSYMSREFPDWVHDYSPDRFSHMVYETSGAAQMADVVRVSTSRNAGYVYATDGRLPLNWQNLPNYWPAEVDTVRQSCWVTSPPTQ
jgi:Spherulation-specific family 4